MEIPKGTPTEAITIGGVSGINVPLPFTEGYKCDDAAAHVLNQVVKENVRNNLRERVKKDKLSKADAQKLVDEYLAGYRFGERTGGFRTTDPVESEAMSIARNLIEQALVNKGTAKKDISAKDVTAKARNLLAHPEKGPKIKAKAAKVVKEREADAETLLAGL